MRVCGDYFDVVVVICENFFDCWIEEEWFFFGVDDFVYDGEVC